MASRRNNIWPSIYFYLHPIEITILRRKEADNEARLRRQIARGRADPEWRLCNDSSCTRLPCLYTEGYSALQDQEVCEGGIPVAEVKDTFVQAMVQQIWPETLRRGAQQRKMMVVESFVNSPPARWAFVQFATGCEENELDPSGEALVQELDAIRPQVEELVSGPGSGAAVHMVHRFAGASRRQMRREVWGLRDFAMQFLVAVESWRRHSKGWSDAWRLGGTEVIADFLLAMLLHLWLMHKEGCFSTERMLSETRQSEIWEAWLGTYSLSELDDTTEVAEGDGDETCIQGVAKYDGPWLYRSGRDAAKPQHASPSS